MKIKSMRKKKAGPPKQLRVVNSSGGFNVIRVGQERSLESDFFHFLLRIHGLALFGYVALFIALSNVLFAVSFLALGDVIKGARPGDFWDALFFSVQTMATVGYGEMHPVGWGANMIASVEAFYGLLSFAIAAGMIFAKFSKPTAKVLFSKVAVIGKRNGREALMFRMSNERNNQILDAKIKLSALLIEKTHEGETIRSFHDLKLLRSEAPIFALTFTAIHFIDEHSPLYQLTPEQLQERQVELVVTFSGVDEVFSQNIFAKTSYISEDLRWRHRFVDIISNREDGARVINLSLFHTSEPLA